MIELILTIVSLGAISAICVVFYIKRKHERPDIIVKEKLTIDTLLNSVKIVLADLVKDEYYFGKDDIEWEVAYKRKRRIQNAMKNCIYGIDADKIIVKDLIRDVVSKHLTCEDDVLQVVDFHGIYLDPMIKWEVMLHFLKKKHGKDALKYLILKYNWDATKYTIEDNTVPSYHVSMSDLDFAYTEEIKDRLSYIDQLEIVSTLIYIKYKGFGCIDTLREMNIDGINCGVSGAILSASFDPTKERNRAARSVWIYNNGKYIHLQFLTFYTEEELKRIVLLICRFGSPGPLTEKRGYMVNTMFDKSRVLAVRPGVGEYWAVFIRKFNIQHVSLEGLYLKENDASNAILPITLIKYLMRGMVTTAFTGRQGSGKTTLLIGAFQYLDARYNIRVLEMTPEMYLRERYPERNIYSVSETQYVSMEALQDALKKSDGGISIIGEVATSAVASRMIQLGQTASEVTYFSHHAKRTRDLVYSLRNSLVETGGFNNLLTAEQQVVDVVRVDVHVSFDVHGFRYIDRITEIVKLDESIPYPKIDKNNLEYSKVALDREYYYRKTDRTSFDTVDILQYNKTTRRYETLNWFSSELTQQILTRMPPTHVRAFKEFVTENWKG
ncbi:MAG: hypothetical protein LBS29_04270 [Endomicrobium sp.]|jgi:pilus assembly protein CpaF|nr:hypothetical protein [Endomicrobium sp.]